MTGTEPSADESATERTRTFVASSGTADAAAAGPVIPAAQPPTEAGFPQPPTEAGFPWQPTQAGAWHPPTEAGFPHPPTEADFPHPPTEAGFPHPPTEADFPWQPTEAGRSAEAPAAAPRPAPAEVVRYGPGVPAAPPADRAQLTAERAWRGGGTAAGRARRPRWLRLLVSWPLTAILLAASGVVLYQRFHHGAIQVTRVTIGQRPQASCGTDVTGRIATNGAAGTVTYQWLVAPQTRPPSPLNQSVGSGQHEVTVTLDIQGTGQGSVSRAVTLQVLSPDAAAVSTTVNISC